MTLEFEGIKWQAGVMLPLITLLSKNAKDVNRWHNYENTFKMEQKDKIIPNKGIAIKYRTNI